MSLLDRLKQTRGQGFTSRPRSLPLLTRLANSNGDPQRTIAALRWLNRLLRLELKRKDRRW